ncbi:MAG TPA: class I SAM-dependent methyltransferase [Chloroflexia bacterium]|nr:class I SAM-dependent methyltransferase [Chloroflexia bacterium]
MIDSPASLTLHSLVGLAPSSWMMAPSEQVAILALLQVLKPQRSLEFGCAAGGLTRWLSHFSAQVVTVDVDPSVVTVTAALPNVTPLCMTTAAAVGRFRTETAHFDFAVIDADHSEAGVRRDLENLLPLADVIILHDSYYPPCRAGMLAALADRDVYADLDFVPGGLQPDGLWGGLGLVLPTMPRATPTVARPRVSVYPYLSRRWRRTVMISDTRKLAGRVVRKAVRTVSRAAGS